MVLYVSGTNNINPYRLIILAALATTTVYTTNSTNNFVYFTSPSTAAAAAGYILLSIINIIWMFYYGTTEEVKLHALIDKYSGHKPTFYASASHQVESMVGRTGGDPFLTRNSHNPRMTMTSRNNNQMGPQSQQLNSSMGGQADLSGYPQTFMAAPLGAFENSSTINHKQQQAGGDAGYLKSHESVGDVSVSDVPATPTVYPYRARAVYSYSANPADANEISFEKGEILEVSDISGKWWQARRVNGQVGICPSNYVVLEKDI